MPPRSKSGSKISSLVSLNTRDGGGRVEPARRQASSQNSINSASTISGGTTRTAVSRAILTYFSATGSRFGISFTTAAGALVRTAADSILLAGIFIDQTSTRLIDSDFRYAAGFSGSNTLPSKKVSLPREVEVGMSDAGTSSSLAASFQRSSRLTLPISALVSKPASNLPQRMSSVRNQRSWLWNG